MSLLSRRAACLGLAAACAALWSCGERSQQNISGPAGGGGGAPGTRYVIGVIAKSSNNQVFLAARQGAEDAARDLSRELGIDIRVQWRTPNTEDATQQAQYVELLASQGVDGIAISCTDANILTPAINSAVERGVTVVTFDSDAAASRRMCYYGVDDRDAGAAVMRELAREMGGSGRVAILAGNQAAPNLQARVQGVREEAARHPGIEIVSVYYHPETPTDAAATMEQVQNSNPSITGWALVGGWPLYTENALDAIAPSAKVVSMDPLELPLQYLIAGQVQVLVGQPYYGWGYESVRLIIDKVHHGRSPDAERITAPLDIVTRDNAQDFVGRWSRWLSPSRAGEGR